MIPHKDAQIIYVLEKKHLSPTLKKSCIIYKLTLVHLRSGSTWNVHEHSGSSQLPMRTLTWGSTRGPFLLRVLIKVGTWFTQAQYVHPEKTPPLGVKVTGCQCYLCDIKDRRKFILDQQNGILTKVVGGPALPVQEIKCTVSNSQARSRGL